MDSRINVTSTGLQEHLVMCLPFLISLGIQILELTTLSILLLNVNIFIGLLLQIQGWFKGIVWHFGEYVFSLSYMGLDEKIYISAMSLRWISKIIGALNLANRHKSSPFSVCFFWQLTIYLKFSVTSYQQLISNGHYCVFPIVLGRNLAHHSLLVMFCGWITGERGSIQSIRSVFYWYKFGQK